MIGNYLLIEKLGDGACKVAYKAENRQTGEKVCLSIFRNIKEPGVEHQDYEDEISSGCLEFSHVNVLRTLDHGCATLKQSGQKDRKVYFIVTELCEKGELYDLIDNLQGASEPISKLLFKQVLDGLSYLHEKGVFHLDMKLENCFVAKDNVVKVADFGFSVNNVTGQTLTRKCGTYGKMAPELLTGQGYEGAPVDVFAFGVLLFEMLTGQALCETVNDDWYNKFMKDPTKLLKERRL